MAQIYSAYEISENGFNKVILEDESNSTRVEIIPSCGAMLHAFQVISGGSFLNIIDSYTNRENFENNAESAGFKGLKLSPFVCRIRDAAYQFNGKKYHFNKLYPDGSAIHGLLYRSAFQVIKLHGAAGEARVLMEYNYDGSDSGYPFGYNCAVEYKLEPLQKLTISTTLKNPGPSSIPVADGWHPYFTFGKKIDELMLQFQGPEIVEFENLIPTGKLLPNKDFLEFQRIGNTVMDHSFVLDFKREQPMCTLMDPASGLALEIFPDRIYRYLQIYTPPHRKSIALENLSGAPDCFNNKMGL